MKMSWDDSGAVDQGFPALRIEFPACCHMWMVGIERRGASNRALRLGKPGELCVATGSRPGHAEYLLNDFTNRHTEFRSGTQMNRRVTVDQ